MTSTIETVQAPDGTSIAVRRWPATGETWAHVLLVHGIHEHSGRYEHVGDWLSAAGLDVTAYDQRGFGRSGGRRAYVDRWSRHFDDLEDRLGAVREAAGDAPVVLYGHSLGGLLALGYVVADTPRPLPDVLVLSAPAIESTTPAWQRAMAAALNAVAPRYGLKSAFDGSLLSRDPAVGEAYGSDPYAFHVTTGRLGTEAFKEQARVREALGRLALPTLVFHGEADPIVPVASSEPLGALPNVTRQTWPDLRHETHNEPEGPEVIAAVVAWLRHTIDPTMEAGSVG
jgi:alpha-beta hydrolase superfamily lysophospholipase